MSKYGKFISVAVEQHGQAYLGRVKFMDALDYETFYHLGTQHTDVTPSSMKRLATAINNLHMSVEFDEYGVPTWTREKREAANE
jgi:hypothetical protein